MKKKQKRILKEFDNLNYFNGILIEKIRGEVADASGLDRIIADNASMTVLLEKIKEARTEGNLTDKQIVQRCMSIHKKILDNIPDNFEINLDKHIFVNCFEIRELEDITIKFRLMDDIAPEYICLNANQMLDTRFFLGGDQRKAYMISKDEQDNLTCAELMDFQLLSILREESRNGDVREYGLLVNYHWLCGKVESTILVGWNLMTLRNFMLSEWFQMLIHNEVNEHEKIGEEKNDHQ